MVSFPSNMSWRPRVAFEGEPFATIAYTTDSELDPAWVLYGRETSLFVAEFLESRLRGDTNLDLGSDSSYLYVVLEREPANDVPEIREGGALVEFGFGEAPAAPEEWECVALRDLMASAIRWLRDSLGPC